MAVFYLDACIAWLEELTHLLTRFDSRYLNAHVTKMPLVLQEYETCCEVFQTCCEVFHVGYARILILA